MDLQPEQKTTTSNTKRNRTIDWELVNDFKQGLKELKEGKAIKC